MTQNLISLELTEDLPQLDAALDTVERMLNAFVSLDAEQMRRLSKIGDKTESFCRQTTAILDQSYAGASYGVLHKSDQIEGLLGRFLGLSLGGTAVLATLAASASYIAVPAALRLALPEANPSLSLTASLGITFPFNIIVGIPLYLMLAEQLIAWGL